MRHGLHILFVLVAASTSCEKAEPSSPASTSIPPSGATSGEPIEPAQPWTTLALDGLDADQQGQLDKAKAAQKKLGGTLTQALTISVAKDGFPASIQFCRGTAPDVAQKISESHGLKIGRTSHKLRNPKNAPPHWASDAVAKAEPGQKVFTGPAGELGVLSPIELAPLCVNCHGSPDKLAEGVAPAIEAVYPEDQATGFAAGDLRGWFWVEVPKS